MLLGCGTNKRLALPIEFYSDWGARAGRSRETSVTFMPTRLLLEALPGSSSHRPRKAVRPLHCEGAGGCQQHLVPRDEGQDQGVATRRASQTLVSDEVTALRGRRGAELASRSSVPTEGKLTSGQD